jgi:hypothetical protein
MVYGNRRANPAFWGDLLQPHVIVLICMYAFQRVDGKTKQPLRLFAT